MEIIAQIVIISLFCMSALFLVSLPASLVYIVMSKKMMKIKIKHASNASSKLIDNLVRFSSDYFESGYDEVYLKVNPNGSWELIGKRAERGGITLRYGERLSEF